MITSVELLSHGPLSASLLVTTSDADNFTDCGPNNAWYLLPNGPLKSLLMDKYLTETNELDYAAFARACGEAGFDFSITYCGALASPFAAWQLTGVPPVSVDGDVRLAFITPPFPLGNKITIHLSVMHSFVK